MHINQKFSAARARPHRCLSEWHAQILTQLRSPGVHSPSPSPLLLLLLVLDFVGPWKCLTMCKTRACRYNYQQVPVRLQAQHNRELSQREILKLFPDPRSNRIQARLELGVHSTIQLCHTVHCRCWWPQSSVAMVFAASWRMAPAECAAGIFWKIFSIFLQRLRRASLLSKSERWP